MAFVCPLSRLSTAIRWEVKNWGGVFRPPPLPSSLELNLLALGGHLPEFALPAFFGASLIALQKKDGGLRPIAVGSVYRRITAKVATSSVSGQIGADLRPIQLGVAKINGCEAAVHAV